MDKDKKIFINCHVFANDISDKKINDNGNEYRIVTLRSNRFQQHQSISMVVSEKLVQPLKCILDKDKMFEQCEIEKASFFKVSYPQLEKDQKLLVKFNSNKKIDDQNYDNKQKDISIGKNELFEIFRDTNNNTIESVKKWKISQEHNNEAKWEDLDLDF